MVKPRFYWIEIFFILFGVVLISGIPYFNSQPPEVNYVPNAVPAMITMVGIMTTFTGFWLTYTYVNIKDDRIKKWIWKRIRAIVVITIFGISISMFSFQSLAYGKLEAAYEQALAGIGILLLVSAEIMFVIAFRDQFEE